MIYTCLDNVSYVCDVPKNKNKIKIALHMCVISKLKKKIKSYKHNYLISKRNFSCVTLGPNVLRCTSLCPFQACECFIGGHSMPLHMAGHPGTRYARGVNVNRAPPSHDSLYTLDPRQ